MTPILSRIRWTDVLTFLLFVVLAAAIWFGHAMQSVRNTSVPVLIQYTGRPGAIGLGAEGLPDTVMIEVRDAGKRLNAYMQEPLRLTIDLRTYIHGEKGTIHVPSDVLRRSISDILQGTSRLISTTPEEITCSYFTEQEKLIPVHVDCSFIPANEYQLVGKPELSQTHIKLFGRDKELAAIDSIHTTHMVLTDLMDTTVVQVPLIIPPGIRAENDSIRMQIVTERYTEKKFIVPLHVSGVPEGFHIRLFPSQVEVSLRVGINHFTDVMPEDVHALCVYSPERLDKLDVTLRYSNPFITTAWVYPSVVEFILEQ